MGVVKDFIEGGTEFLVGGKKKQKTTTQIEQETEEEKKLRNQLLQLIQGLSGPGSQYESDLSAARASAPTLSSQDKQIQDLFRNNLISYLSGPSAQGRASPEQVASATDFVDQTFTAPARQQLQEFQKQFGEQQSQQAAILGRQPLDTALQDRTAQNLAPLFLQLGAERGSRIAQRTDEVPLRNIQVGLQGLSGVNNILNQQGFQSNFLSNLANQALSNRINLASAQSQGFTGLLDRLRQERFGRAGQTQTGTQDRGLAGFIGGIQQVAQPFAGLFAGGAGGGASSGMGGLGGGQGANPFGSIG